MDEANHTHDFQVILLVGDLQSQLLSGLKTAFASEQLVSIVHESWSDRLTEQCTTLLPDLIAMLIEPEPSQEVLAWCKNVRAQDTSYHAILLVLGDPPEQTRIQLLRQGADDVLSGRLSPEELHARFLSHLRRSLDVSLHEMTLLPGLRFTARIVERRLRRGAAVAVLLLEIKHFDVYQDIYGELPARQVLKTLASVIGRFLMVPDFICHTEEDYFLIVTTPDKAEKVASLICRQFATVAPNFYSEKDRKQGYIVSTFAGKISRRVPLLSLKIGLAGTLTQPPDACSFLSLFNRARQMQRLAGLSPGNAWQSDRILLGGDTVSTAHVSPRRIFIVETDAALAYLLNVALGMEGYEVSLVSDLDDARRSFDAAQQANTLPDLVVLDTLIHDEKSGLLFMQEIHDQQPHLPIICASTLPHRQEALQSGAHLYLPRPFELSTLFAWIHRLLHEA